MYLHRLNSTRRLFETNSHLVSQSDDIYLKKKNNNNNIGISIETVAHTVAEWNKQKILQNKQTDAQRPTTILSKQFASPFKNED